MSISADVELKDEGRRLILHAAGQRREFAALWLRERAPDDTTLDTRTGQRLIEAAQLPLTLRAETASCEAGSLHVRFSDGHATAYALNDLLLDTDADHAEVEPGLRLWDAGLDSLPQATFASALEDDGALLAMLEDLHRYGFVKVSGVPCEADGMQPLIDRIGPLRRTNWGGIADVKSVANAFDLTMTQRGLEPHTDNPYRDPIPGYIWLHCLSNAADGGDSTLTDGFMAAQRLKAEAPEDFACLTHLSPRFRYTDATTDLESEGPLIELDSRGRLARVRYSNRTERIAAHDAALLERYYAARQRFYRLITDEALTVHLKLGPGDMLIMDNYRLLHGRTAYQLEGGVRHLRQGYVDRDSTASRRRVLGAQLAGNARPGASHTAQGVNP